MAAGFHQASDPRGSKVEQGTVPFMTLAQKSQAAASVMFFSLEASH